jgi:formate dehydrogenase assembly factor FdhD
MMTTIWRYDYSGTAIRCENEVTEERALTIYANGTLTVRLASSGTLVDAAAVGHALMQSWNLREAVLMRTGHIRAQALAQAARVGIPVLASRSATTAQAIALAERVGTTVVAFVRAGHMNV